MSFVNIFRKITNTGSRIGSYFLAGIMILVVGSIVIRPFGRAIPGSYEVIELLIVVPVAFGFAYTMLQQGHISVDFLMARLNPKAQAIVAGFTYILSLGIWVVIGWANTNLMIYKWLREKSQFLEIPFLPFRIVWVFGLLLFCVGLGLEVYNAVKEAAKS
jgi:TRAP-type C4-dicarboxylate transport system permease small subunit